MLETSRSFPLTTACVGDVRRFVRETVGDRPQLEDAELVADELAANAARYGLPDVNGGFEVRVGVNGQSVQVSVASGSSHDTLPHVCPAPTESGEHGRGLAIVDALAKEWGSRRDGDRTEVWARLM